MRLKQSAVSLDIAKEEIFVLSKLHTTLPILFFLSASFSCGKNEDSQANNELATKTKTQSDKSRETTPSVPESYENAPKKTIIAPKGSKPRHFSFLTAAKDSLLFGDMPGTHSSLVWMSLDQSASQPRKWLAHWQQLQSSLLPLDTSNDVAALSGAVAQAAQTCGNCHRDLGITPTVLVPEPKRRGIDFKDHMAGHRWALDQMWSGLATPSEENWQRGADLLANVPTHLRKLSAYGNDAQLAMELATTVHALAAKAKTEKSPDKRVIILGEFLAACADCHVLAGSEPSKAAN